MTPSPIASVDDGGRPIVWHPALGRYTSFNTQVLPENPDDQVAQTIGLMAQYASEDSRCPAIQQAARMAQAQTSDGDPLVAVWHWVKSRISFVQDQVTGAPVEALGELPVVEVLIRPRDMGDWGIGDCDDFVMYGASLLMALGVPVRFATVAADASAPNEYSHVYLVAYPVDERGSTVRVPMDLSHGKHIGWETENRFGKLTEWPVSGGSEMVKFAGVVVAALGLWWACRGMMQRTA